MKKKNRLRYGVCGVIMLCMIVFSWYRIESINRKFPQTKHIYVKEGEPFCAEEFMELTTKSYQWMDKKQLKKQFGEEMSLNDKYDYRGLIIEITLKNKSRHRREFELYNLYLETDTHYYNGLDMEMFMVGGNQTVVTLGGGESKKICLAYSMSSVSFSKKEWSQLEKNNFYLVNERYPQKVYWEV
ncbi:MAG: hypothetical protein PUC12_12290 [Clostridiales bacterium]|nr:hypothetical protein [Clostridiales bacterium]